MAALAAAVAALSSATTVAVQRATIDPARYFPACATDSTTLARRLVKYRAALAMGRDVYVVPVVPDSQGFPALDMADRSKVDSTTYLSVLCTMPHDSTIVPNNLVQPDTAH